MLYSQLKEVLKLDETINNLHKELDTMYKKRAEYLQQSTMPDTFPAGSSKKLTLEIDSLPSLEPRGVKTRKSPSVDDLQLTHENLKASWERLGVRVPAFALLKKRLGKAATIITKIETAHPDFAGQFAVVLVPPAKTMAFPVPAALREQQSYPATVDRVRLRDKPRGVNKWRVLVALTSREGIYLGSPQQIIAQHSYKIVGQDMLDLGPVEYSALTLQLDEPIDQVGWSVLLRDLDGKSEAEVPVAHFSGDSYMFSTTDFNSVFAADRFRPTVEIN